MRPARPPRASDPVGPRHALPGARACALLGGLTVAVAACASNVPDGQVIRIDTTQTFQTMLGWEVTAWIGQWACPPDTSRAPIALPFYRDQVIEMAADLGINRVRVELRSGAEAPVDVFAAYRDGRASSEEWRQAWYAPINDNDDPFVIDSAGFHFGEVDLKIREIVVPLRTRLEERGERLYVNLNYISFPSGIGSAMHREDPEEYAELMLAAFQHIDRTWGFVPDAVEIALEPDMGRDPWTPTQIANAMLATARRLRGAGYAPDFIAPSTLNMATGVAYYKAMMAIPGVAGLLSEFSYHRYQGSSRSSAEEIGRIQAETGIRTAMLERRYASYDEIHEDLGVANNSSWQQYALAGCSPDEPVGRLFSIDATDPMHPVVSLSTRAQYLQQYFRHVRRGAIRVAATTIDPQLDPLAFINADGNAVVIVKADGPRRFSLLGLPPGRYSATFTTGPDDHAVDASAVAASEVIIERDQAVDLAIPERGVLTVFGESVDEKS